MTCNNLLIHIFTALQWRSPIIYCCRIGQYWCFLSYGVVTLYPKCCCLKNVQWLAINYICAIIHRVYLKVTNHREQGRQSDHFTVSDFLYVVGLKSATKRRVYCTKMQLIYDYSFILIAQRIFNSWKSLCFYTRNPSLELRITWAYFIILN